MVGTDDTKLFLADTGVTFNGTNFTTTLERRGLNAGRTDAVKQISRVYPRIEGTGTVSISVGAELAPNSGVIYNDPVTFTIGTDNKVDCRVKGRYAAIKIESDAASQFRLSGLRYRSRDCVRSMTREFLRFDPSTCPTELESIPTFIDSMLLEI